MRDLAEEGKNHACGNTWNGFCSWCIQPRDVLTSGLVEEQGDPAKLFTAPESERLQQFISSIY